MQRAAALAALARAGLPFPGDHGEQPAQPGGEHSCTEFGVLGEVMPGGAYLHFWCPGCDSHMYQANSGRGVIHARKISKPHKPSGCCAERATWGKPSIWPDEE